ncbi:MAG TPA: hypothetical protein V6D14_12665 [Coleofasciculaceae cyanobacterium]
MVFAVYFGSFPDCFLCYATGCPGSSWTTYGRRADRLKLVRLLDQWSIPQLWHGYSFFPSHASVSLGLTAIANALRVGDRLIEQLVKIEQW